MSERKKILVLSSFSIFPPYWGGASRVYNITKILAQKNKIWFVCNDLHFLKDSKSRLSSMKEFSSNPNIQNHIVKVMGPKSQLLNVNVIREALRIIKKEKPDLIFANHLYSSINAIILKFLTGLPYILDEHNVEFLLHERIHPKRKLSRMCLKMLEKLACKLASKVFCVSENDGQLFISRLGIKNNKIAVIPNGVDTEKFYPNESKNYEIKQKFHLLDKKIILFFGKLDYLPNIEAVKIIHDEILPRIAKKITNAKFIIVGDNPPLNFKHDDILFTGLVDNIEEYINVSDIVICPLLSGGGTRIKILEALACGSTVISTTVGAEGINFNDYKDILLICDDWESFSNEIIHSLTKDITFKEHDFYRISWEKSADDISKVLQNLIS